MAVIVTETLGPVGVVNRVVIAVDGRMDYFVFTDADYEKPDRIKIMYERIEKVINNLNLSDADGEFVEIRLRESLDWARLILGEFDDLGKN